MARLIVQHAYPWQIANERANSGEYQVLTVSRLARKAIGGQVLLLRDTAERHLVSSGKRIASPLETYAVLDQVLQDTVKLMNVKGIARAWMPSVQALLRSCARIKEDQKNISPSTLIVLPDGI